MWDISWEQAFGMVWALALTVGCFVLLARRYRDGLMLPATKYAICGVLVVIPGALAYFVMESVG